MKIGLLFLGFICFIISAWFTYTDWHLYRPRPIYLWDYNMLGLSLFWLTWGIIWCIQAI